MCNELVYARGFYPRNRKDLLIKRRKNSILWSDWVWSSFCQSEIKLSKRNCLKLKCKRNGLLLLLAVTSLVKYVKLRLVMVMMHSPLEDHGWC